MSHMAVEWRHKVRIGMKMFLWRWLLPLHLLGCLVIALRNGLHKNPYDIMELVLPNKDFLITLKYNDWRFDSSCKLRLSAGHMKKLYAPCSQKTFSRSWTNVETRHVTWEVALSEVHDFTWRKWKLVIQITSWIF